MTTSKDTQKNKLIIEQLDRKFAALRNLENISVPQTGWIHTIRTALNMTLNQLGKKVGITSPSIKEIEVREKKGTITLNTLNKVAHALNMKVVYALVPKDQSLEALIEKAAFDAAKKIVGRTSISMKLEDQENSDERLRQAITSKAEEIIRGMPKYLWD